MYQSGVHSSPFLPTNESCRDEILYELRDQSKRLNSVGRQGLNNDIISPKGRVASYDTLDFFAIRWKNWKLLAGTKLALQGWTSKSGQKDEYRKFMNVEGQMKIWSIDSGTFLFDLSTDVGEEHNVADKYPDILMKLMDKKQGYLDKMKTVEAQKFSDKGKVDGVWKPWVEL